MNNATLVILAAGMGSRYGGLKQVDPVGPKGEAIIEYSVYDAIRAGFNKVVFVIREEIEEAFKAKFSNKFDDKIEVAYAYQAINSPIEGLKELPERQKPWGTGHAVLVTAGVVDSPFSVINADDYYGISAFQSMAKFLKEDCRPNLFAMIGYVLEKTLSDHGSVNRGICQIDERGHLQDIVERHKIATENGAITYDEDEQRVPLSNEALASMNMFGFHPSIFEAARQQFLTFVRANQENPKAEFYIPFVVNQMIKNGQADVQVLTSRDQWYGVTYREDRPMVEKAFEKLTADGYYPSNGLW